MTSLTILAALTLESLLGGLVSGVLDPSVGLHQHRGAQVLIGIPPVRGARCGAARAKNALTRRKFRQFKERSGGELTWYEK